MVRTKNKLSPRVNFINFKCPIERETNAVTSDKLLAEEGIKVGATIVKPESSSKLLGMTIENTISSNPPHLD